MAVAAVAPAADASVLPPPPFVYRPSSNNVIIQDPGYIMGVFFGSVFALARGHSRE